jgi:Na+-driven multidrug efflux pump
MAMKQQNLILSTSIIDFYLIGIPMSALLAFNLGMSVNGLFLGGCISSVVGSAIVLVKLYRIDIKA